MAQALDGASAQGWEGLGPAAVDAACQDGEAGVERVQARLVAELGRQRTGQGAEQQTVQRGGRGEGLGAQRSHSNVVKVIGLYPFLQGGPNSCF
jgi:hypothetical protein